MKSSVHAESVERKVDKGLNCAGQGSVILPYEVTGEYFVDDLGELPAKPAYDFFKRAFDIVLSLLMIVVFMPVMVVIAGIICCTSTGCVFYAQERLGLNGKPFRMVKFRSMRADAERDGAQWSSGDDDPRITPFGRFLRKTRLDELPQLWCILMGTMSFVGPRPERGCFYEEFEKYIHGFSQRMKVKPGLTGLAQVSGGYDLRPEEKIVFDVEYIRKRSIWLDLRIVLRTVEVVLTYRGAK